MKNKSVGKMIGIEQEKHGAAWFKGKVAELGEAIERLPRRRQLELFAELEDSNDKDDLQEERESNLTGGRPIK